MGPGQLISDHHTDILLTLTRFWNKRKYFVNLDVVSFSGHVPTQFVGAHHPRYIPWFSWCWVKTHIVLKDRQIVDNTYSNNRNTSVTSPLCSSYQSLRTSPKNCLNLFISLDLDPGNVHKQNSEQSLKYYLNINAWNWWPSLKDHNRSYI